MLSRTWMLFDETYRRVNSGVRLLSNMIPASIKKLFYRSDGSPHRVRIGVCLFVLFVVLIANGIYLYRVNKVPRIEKDLEREFAQVHEPTLAFPVNPRPSSFDHGPQVLISNHYRAELSYAEVRAYYDSELAKHGWKCQREEGVLIWGEDSGGKEAYYSKGSYTAVLYYLGQGERERLGWTYSLDMSWGL